MVQSWTVGLSISAARREIPGPWRSQVRLGFERKIDSATDFQHDMLIRQTPQASPLVWQTMVIGHSMSAS